MKRIILLIALISIGVSSFAQNSTLAKGKKVNIEMSEAGMKPGTSATSGSLTTGLSYVIGLFVAGDDFTNVGAGSNASGVEFIATGTTPTTWTNSSLLSALNQSTTDLADNSTITANNVYPTQGVRGNGQKWFNFDGTDDYVNIADAAAFDFGTLDFTLHATFTPDNVTDQNKYIVNKEAGGVGYGLQQYEDDIKIRFDDNTTDVSAIIATGVLTADTEVVVFVTFDRSGNATCYVDGVASGTVAISTANLTLSNAGALRIGTETGGTTNAFNGDISWVGEYNYMPSADSITSWSTKIDEGTFHLPAVDQGATNTVLTSGTLELGKIYLIIDWITNDDFTNVGGANVDGTVFTCAGSITPTVWTNSSTVVELGSTLSLSPEGIYSTAWNDYYHLTSYAVDGPTRQEYGKHTALRFNGADSYLMKADADFDGTGGMVIAGWFEANGWGEGTVSSGGRLLDASTLMVLLNSDDESIRATRNSLSSSVYSAVGSVELNKWIFFTVTSTSTGVTNIYIGDKDNSPVLSLAAGTAGGTPVDGGDLYIGNDSGEAKTFNGTLDFRIWYLDKINMPIEEWITLLYESTK
ncbi:MAG: hypothetical protein HN977_17680 [Gammaproteobacteria bacterium]|nr:hypothetical protein [Gammaproteobacteria bacterium]